MKHCFIPDTQITPTCDTNHIKAAANYIADKRPDKIIIIGDWWDMASLSTYDKPGSHGWEAKDVKADFDCGIDAMDMFLGTVLAKRKYNPEVHFFFGNHENRAKRASEDPMHSKFRQYLTDDNFNLGAYPVIVHPFLEIAMLDGICYSHYMQNPESLLANPIGGSIQNKLWKLGHSFTMGHQQHKQYGSVYTCTGERRNGLVCGRFYQHEQDYLGPQKNKQSWSGIFMKHEVRNGDYDLMEVSMDYLLREWQ